MISIIVAAAENNCIGKSNDLPWDLPDDLKRFATLTKGKTVFMGLKTWQSIISRIGKPLPGRRNVVLTLEKNDSINAEQVTSIADAVALLSGEEEAFVIGGASVYEQMLPYADKVYLTRVHAEVQGDAYFPKLDPKIWKLCASFKHPKDDRHTFAFSFQEYVKEK